MKTEDIIKELELNYGYTFAKEGTDNKWQFEWICEMINDVQDVVTENCNLHVVSQRSELLKAFIRWNNKHNGIAQPVPEKMADNYLKSL